jgi:hypothetical protein
MRYFYPVTIETNPTTGRAETAIIPQPINTRIDLTAPRIQREIAALGYTRFLELYITDILRQRDEDGYDISPPEEVLEGDAASQTHLYLFSSPEQCNPKNLSGNGIALMGTGSLRQAYYIENRKFVTRNRVPLTLDVTVSEEALTHCPTEASDTHQPIAINRDNSMALETLIHDLNTRAKRPQANPHHFLLRIPIQYRSKNRCHCCEDYLPAFTRLTLTLEWIAIIPLSAGTLKMTEKKLFPQLSNDGLNYSTYITAVMNSFVIWYMTTRGPGSENQYALGQTFDRFFHGAHRLICCDKARHVADADMTQMDRVSDAISILLKTLLTIFVLNFIASSAAQDFTQNLVVTESIEDPDAWPSPAVTTVFSFSAFGLNQFNDPALILGFLTFGLKEINNYIYRRRLANTKAHIEEVAEKDPIDQLEKGESKKEALHERLLSGLAPISPRLLLTPPASPSTTPVLLTPSGTQPDPRKPS